MIRQTNAKTGPAPEQKDGLFRRIGERPALRRTLQALAVLGVSFLQTYQLHYSAADGYKHFFTLSLPVILLNVGLLLWLNLGAKLLFQKWHVSILVTTLLTTLWSIANFFVLKFHGSPLFFSEFANFGTAMNVIEGYRFVWERRITWLLLLAAACVIAALILRACRKRGAKFWNAGDFLLTLAAFAGASLLLWMCLFVWKTPKPRKTFTWSWRKGVEGYGYATIIVEELDHSLHALKEPADYDAAHLEAVAPAEAGPLPETLPDIILIINESFYDLREYVTFTADADPLEALEGIEGAVCGKLAITSAGGSTNNTEFEVLTSCSMHLLTRTAPFNYINLNGLETCAPRYLKALGYSSAALHCGNGANYSRNRAFPAMGFDETVLGEKAFTIRSYGNRPVLDSDNYRDMLRCSETLGDGPRFVYLLTFQNHGGWEKNDAALDTVHVREDFGELTDDLNEYLTSVRMSAEAFRELTELLSESERPTLVCMIGDHAPSFLTGMEADPPGDETDLQIRQRLVPCVLWSNYGQAFPEEMRCATSVDLLPLLYEAAGIPVSSFQKAILSIHREIPIRTLSGSYRDWEGNTGEIAGSPWEAAVELSYELEYNALRRGSDYRRELFVCPE